jgi:hypothetical protein
MPQRPAWGLANAIPAAVDGASWGARLIFPDDLVWDRQGAAGHLPHDVAQLVAWLNQGKALDKALRAARRAADKGTLTRDGDQQVILYRDSLGVIVACPNASHGYLYVAGWLHDGKPEKQPAPEFTVPRQPGLTFEPVDGYSHPLVRVTNAAGDLVTQLAFTLDGEPVSAPGYLFPEVIAKAWETWERAAVLGRGAEGQNQ